MEKGPSRPTLFRVQLPSRRVSTETNDFIEFYCTAAALPEVRSNTVAVAGHEYMGVVREQPTAIMFGKPFIIEVIADPEYKAYFEIREWFEGLAQNANQGQGAFRTQRMNYYSTFVEDLVFTKLEQSGEGQGSFDYNGDYTEAFTARFINAYPVQLDQISFNSEEQDSFVRFRVAFTYESYYLERGL